MEGLFLLGSLFGVIAFMLPTVLVLGLVIVIALRGDPDEAGGRAATLYLALATFVGIFTLLIANTALAASITDLVSDDDDSGRSFRSAPAMPDDFSSDGFSTDDFSSEDFSSDDFSERFGDDDGQDADDRAITSIIQAMIAIAASLVVLWFHWPRLEAVRSGAVAGSASDRMRQAYCYTVCFTTVVTLLVSASVATFSIVQAIAPDTTGAANRGDAIEGFVPVAVLAVGAALIFRLHWARLDLPSFLRPAPAAPAAPPAPPGDAPAV